MNRSLFNRLLWVPVIAAGIGSQELYAAEMTTPVKVLKCTQDNGDINQALLLRLGVDAPGVVAHEHLIFVDTSASQVGTHRLQTLTVLDSMLKTLPATDRVRLFAVDVDADSLMTEFTNVNDDAVKSAIDALKSRIPLGATNLQAMFTTALKEKTPKEASSIVYIGDGMSTADLLEMSELRGIVSSLRQQKVPFHSYGVGPVINLQVLGIFAHQTGGYIDFDNHSEVAVDRGAQLAEAVQRPVYFPTSIQISGRQLPLLPLRSDRETIHLIRGQLASDAKVVVKSANPTDLIELRLSSPVESKGSAFLSTFARQAEKDQGLTNPLAGQQLMDVFEERFVAAVDGTLQQGEEKLAKGQLDHAERIAREVAEIDPANSGAKSLTRAAERLRVLKVSQDTQIEDDGLNSQIEPNPNASLTQEQQQATRVKTEKLRNQVHNAIEDARRGEPDAGIARLKQIDNSVRASIDIAPEDRLQLLKRLDAEINQLSNLADKRAQERVQRAEQLAQLEAQKLLTDQASLDENTLTGLIERIRGLMLEGWHGRDDAFGEAQNVADVAINLRPGEKSSAAARFDSEAAQQLVRSYRLRARRADQFLETLHQVELSHIPFPDEPPVRFPPADVWTALTARRQKWKSVDLRSDHPREQRIQEELKAVSTANFTDIPLKDAIDVLKEQHQIEIQFDEKALSDEGISKEKEVNLVLSGVTLRSLLKLLLEPLQLTYVIEDEVMKITTATAAATKMPIRVYPVADLVTIMQSGGGGGGGMMGGMGGGMGGMGGGMGGMGGGMGGMGMGGMGGGMFSVPAEAVPRQVAQANPAPAKIDNKTIQGLKKKQPLQ